MNDGQIIINWWCIGSIFSILFYMVLTEKRIKRLEKENDKQ